MFMNVLRDYVKQNKCKSKTSTLSFDKTTKLLNFYTSHQEKVAGNETWSSQQSSSSHRLVLKALSRWQGKSKSLLDAQISQSIWNQDGRSLAI